jgi:maltose/moltooligosaccharide transporter
MKKPNLSVTQIINMSVGFLGIQMGFALQNGNASRILQTFGADVHELSWFWIVAPLTGMIVQPIIGHYSDNTWNRLGRRRPYFLVGAILASLGLLFMPNAAVLSSVIPALWIGAGLLMIMDASFNIAMEPFRALVGDKLNSSQRTIGFSVQTILIGIGAVVGSWLPYALGRWFGVETQAEPGHVPPNVIWSFVIGAICLISAIIYTIVTTPEYSPEENLKFEDGSTDQFLDLDKNLFTNLKDSLVTMPETMRQLGLVQFFTWFGLFGMWVNTTPAIAQNTYGLTPGDVSSATFNEAGNWVGIIFGVYNLVATLYAFLLPTIAGKIGRKKTHMFSLTMGGLGLISMYFVKDPNLLIVSMIGVGIAWASILAMPYAILAGSIPLKKMGIYMGIFNLFITIPQIVNAILGGFIVKYLFQQQPIYMLVLAGVSLIIAALLTLRVKDVDEVIA